MEPVIEIHKNDAGVWEAEIVHVQNSHDIETIDLGNAKQTQCPVRIGADAKTMTVFQTAVGSYIRYSDAF